MLADAVSRPEIVLENIHLRIINRVDLLPEKLQAAPTRASPFQTAARSPMFRRCLKAPELGTN